MELEKCTSLRSKRSALIFGSSEEYFDTIITHNFGALVSALGPRPVWNDNFYLKIFNSFEWICTTCQGFTEIISSRNSNFFQAKAGRGRHDIFLGHHRTCLMTWTNQTFVDISNFVSVLRLLNFVNNLTPDAQPSTMFVRFFLGPR